MAKESKEKSVRVRMRTLSAGPDGVRQAGQEYDVPAGEAEQLIAGRFAERVESSPAEEPPPAAPAASNAKK